MKNVEYQPNKGDYAFFICPPNRITVKSKQILEDNTIDLYEFASKNIEELIGMSESKPVKEKKPVIDVISEEETEDVIILKEPRYKLEDIKGIAKTRVDQLREIGVGKTSIDKWKQTAKQLIYG